MAKIADTSSTRSETVLRTGMNVVLTAVLLLVGFLAPVKNYLLFVPNLSTDYLNVQLKSARDVVGHSNMLATERPVKLTVRGYEADSLLVLSTNLASIIETNSVNQSVALGLCPAATEDPDGYASCADGLVSMVGKSMLKRLSGDLTVFEEPHCSKLEVCSRYGGLYDAGFMFFAEGMVWDVPLTTSLAEAAQLVASNQNGQHDDAIRRLVAGCGRSLNSAGALYILVPEIRNMTALMRATPTLAKAKLNTTAYEEIVSEAVRLRIDRGFGVVQTTCKNLQHLTKPCDTYVGAADAVSELMSWGWYMSGCTAAGVAPNDCDAAYAVTLSKKYLYSDLHQRLQLLIDHCLTGKCAAYARYLQMLTAVELARALRGETSLIKGDIIIAGEYGDSFYGFSDNKEEITIPNKDGDIRLQQAEWAAEEDYINPLMVRSGRWRICYTYVASNAGWVTSGQILNSGVGLPMNASHLALVFDCYSSWHEIAMLRYLSAGWQADTIGTFPVVSLPYSYNATAAVGTPDGAAAANDPELQVVSRVSGNTIKTELTDQIGGILCHGLINLTTSATCVINVIQLAVETRGYTGIGPFTNRSVWLSTAVQAPSEVWNVKDGAVVAKGVLLDIPLPPPASADRTGHSSEDAGGGGDVTRNKRFFACATSLGAKAAALEKQSPYRVQRLSLIASLEINTPNPDGSTTKVFSGTNYYSAPIACFKELLNDITDASVTVPVRSVDDAYAGLSAAAVHDIVISDIRGLLNPVTAGVSYISILGSLAANWFFSRVVWAWVKGNYLLQRHSRIKRSVTAVAQSYDDMYAHLPASYDFLQSLPSLLYLSQVLSIQSGQDITAEGEDASSSGCAVHTGLVCIPSTKLAAVCVGLFSLAVTALPRKAFLNPSGFSREKRFVFASILSVPLLFTSSAVGVLSKTFSASLGLHPAVLFCSYMWACIMLTRALLSDLLRESSYIGALGCASAVRSLVIADPQQEFPAWACDDKGGVCAALIARVAVWSAMLPVNRSSQILSFSKGKIVLETLNKDSGSLEVEDKRFLKIGTYFHLRDDCLEEQYVP